MTFYFEEPSEHSARPPQPQQVYSQHYLAKDTASLAEPADADLPDPVSSLADSPEAGFRISKRSCLLGLLGLMALAGIIWGVVASRSSSQADAQEAPDSVAAAVPLENKTPWQSASFPVENFVAYTSPFGYRNHPFGGRRFHYGLDIAAPMGSYVRAWWEGTVVQVSDDTACGTGVVIESHGWLHIYCHLQGYVVIETDGDRWMVDRQGGIQIRQGDLVKSGKRIGRVGMTGSTTGPHLHWGMKYQGSWVDPTVVLKAMIEQ